MIEVNKHCDDKIKKVMTPTTTMMVSKSVIMPEPRSQRWRPRNKSVVMVELAWAMLEEHEGRSIGEGG